MYTDYFHINLLHDRECYINNMEALSLVNFTKKASGVVKGLLFVKVRNSDERWGQYVFESIKRYRNGDDYQEKILATTLGQQHKSDTWVLSPTVQIDGDGNLIPVEQQKYYWDAEYMRVKCIDSLSISLPLNQQVYVRVMVITSVHPSFSQLLAILLSQ